MKFPSMKDSLHRWFGSYFADWCALNWRQRKSAIHHRRQGQKHTRTTRGRYRELRRLEPVPRNAQVAKTYTGFHMVKTYTGLQSDRPTRRIVWLSVRRFPRIIGAHFITPSWDIRVPVAK